MEACLKGRCWSPVACDSFGYCRERNMAGKHTPEQTSEKLERLVIAQPAYDKRSPIPEENYGIGAVRFMFVLKGPRGAVHFLFSSGMYLPSAVEHLIRVHHEQGWGLGDMARSALAPMGLSVGYHSPRPMFEGQPVAQESCGFLDGKPCYCDGSALVASKWMERFIQGGTEWLWRALEEEYRDRFGVALSEEG
jgi:hypothetical protein